MNQSQVRPTAATIVALVGHSAAGKSACLRQLNADPEADMDNALGTRESPSLLQALNWLTDSRRPAIVVVSNHEEMLKLLHAAKRSGTETDKLAMIHFVYLFKPKNRLERHLLKPTAGGSARPATAQIYTLRHYDRFHNLFTELADEVVDCSKDSTVETAEKVRVIAERSIAKTNPTTWNGGNH